VVGLQWRVMHTLSILCSGRGVNDSNLSRIIGSSVAIPWSFTVLSRESYFISTFLFFGHREVYTVITK